MNPSVKKQLMELKERVVQGELSPRIAAQEILEAFLKHANNN